jgi:hypothetical protein
VQPRHLALDAQLGFVEVPYRRSDNLLSDLFDGVLPPSRTLSLRSEQRPRAEGDSKEVLHQLPKSLVGHQRIVLQVDQVGAQVRAVLHCAFDLRRELPP